jgi:sodium-independent sulfate anion transporter 11
MACWGYTSRLILTVANICADLIAGLTVGIVVVPQSMSYAKVATLPVQYGLYSSFVGVFIYCFFATSKDVTIGPVAVMSLQTAHVIQVVQSGNPNAGWSPELIATTLAFFCGVITLGLGILRLGFIIEFIPRPAIAGFMTGSAITIALGQVPSLLGISNYFNTRAAAYLVLIDTLKYLPKTNLNAAFGLPALFVLYFYRWFFNYLDRRYPKYRRTWFYFLILRNGIVIIFITLISWGVCKSNPKNPPISILETVPRGFQDVGALQIDDSLAGALGAQLPISVVVLVLEHISIAKSFGRVNDYKIVPDQELIAIGVTNLIGTFFNAYPATGSFSRSAIKSKAGVRTPLAGIITGAVVILALYELTSAFYWIPNAGLAASNSPRKNLSYCIVIIHAVGDLIVTPKQSYEFWKISPIEFCIFMASIIVTMFTTLEGGIYTAVGASLVIMLYRIARPRGEFLGRVKLQGIEGQGANLIPTKYRTTYTPLARKNLNPEIHVEDPAPGVIIYRFEESFTFPNSSRLNDILADYAKDKTRKGRVNQYKKLGDRPWNEGYVPRSMDKILQEADHDGRPILRAVVYDFGAVSNIDSTGIQALVDTRQQLDKYADRNVEYHFANILSPWIKRALVGGGFGKGTPAHRVVEISSVVPIEAQEDPNVIKQDEDYERRQAKKDLEHDYIEPIPSKRSLQPGQLSVLSNHSVDSEIKVVYPTNYPFFHFDLDDAVRAAEKAPQ